VVGRVVLTKNPAAMKRASEDLKAYIKEMVEVWHMPESEAKDLSSDRYAFLAVPLQDDNDNVVAVVFLDSSDRDFFDDGMIKMVVRGCGGLATFAKGRYPK
jgi:hypothetical protein